MYVLLEVDRLQLTEFRIDIDVDISMAAMHSAVAFAPFLVAATALVVALVHSHDRFEAKFVDLLEVQDSGVVSRSGSDARR